MKFVLRPLSLAFALFAAGAPSWAAQHDEHKAHHPAGTAPDAASKSMPDKTTPEMARMANHRKPMQEMHDKMMSAKTPEERNALMAEHMKTMQEGMGMMKSMGGMGGPKSPPTSMTERQAMMEMMADRLPQTPAKP